MSVTLAELEVEVARRVGPYLSAFTDRQVPNTANFTFVDFPELRSAIDQDLVTNLWLLRRGITVDGAPVSMDVVDRHRTVDVYDPQQGRVFPDRAWGTIPEAGEICEFHHLHPERELRVSVLAGLRRCFLPDAVQVQPTGLYGGIDLTVQFPWLTESWQLARTRYGWLSPYGDAPWDTYSSMGHLILTGSHGTFAPMSVWVDIWRPASSWVNGAESITGPTDDADILEVNLDYAAAAGHIEAWHLFPSRMQAAAAGSLQATREQAAQEFSRLANVYGPKRPITLGFQSVMHTVSGTWVNGPW